MPPEEAKTSLSADELALLRHWIEAGAPPIPQASPPLAAVSPKQVADLIHADLTNLMPRDRRFARYFSIANLANAGLTGDE